MGRITALHEGLAEGFLPMGECFHEFKPFIETIKKN